ncbi:unnamed protein product [marine sediment metagenome]|uniref:Uncharacterized protein n=1 Tax=marine sediment metagenome TaxID=412755 RepID=X1B5N3_9ZZZZ
MSQQAGEFGVGEWDWRSQVKWTAGSFVFDEEADGAYFVGNVDPWETLPPIPQTPANEETKRQQHPSKSTTFGAEHHPGADDYPPHA